MKEQKRKRHAKQAHQQIQKNCANEKIKTERKCQVLQTKLFLTRTNGGQQKDKSLFLDPNKKNKVENGMVRKKRSLKTMKRTKNK